MNNSNVQVSGKQTMPWVIEIVGPAGAGKTTLYQALSRYSGHFQLSNFPDVRRVTDAPFFVTNGLRLISTLLPLYQNNSRQLSRREFAWMIILLGWPTILQNDKKNAKKDIILDQGPVYLMAEMRLFGPDYLLRQRAEKLWHDFYRRWAGTLDVIIWLDAPDEELLTRIRIRSQEHMIKNESAPTVFDFLARYRREYDHLFSVLTDINDSPRILRFDTSREKPDEIADRLLVEFDASQVSVRE
jgi:deoxyadenosine/deoxycytidine kinase